MDGTLHHETGNAPCHSLIYASTALFPPRDVLLDIVRTAERENARYGLSGMLCYAPTCYIQLLEGPGPVLDRLWWNLSRDLRHRMLWTVRRPPAPRRISPRLPMGYASETQIREWGEPLFGPGLGAPPDAAASAQLAGRIGALAARIYPSTCAAEADG